MNIWGRSRRSSWPRKFATYVAALLLAGGFVPVAHSVALLNPSIVLSKGSVENSFKVTFTTDSNADHYEVRIYDLNFSSTSPGVTVTDYVSGEDITGSICDVSGYGGAGNFCHSIALGHIYAATIKAIPISGVVAPDESPKSNKAAILWGDVAPGGSSNDSSAPGISFRGSSYLTHPAQSMTLYLYRSTEVAINSGDNRGVCTNSSDPELSVLYRTVSNFDASNSSHLLELPGGYCYQWTTKYIAPATPDSDGVTWFDSEVTRRYTTQPYVYRQITPPENISVVTGNRKIIMTWDPPINSTIPVARYGVSISPNGADWYASTSTFQDSTARSFEFTSFRTTSGGYGEVENGVPYFVRIQAYGVLPDAKSSAIVQAPGSYVAATTPSEVNYSSISAQDSAITLNWSAPDGNGGSPLTGYLGQYSTDGSSWTNAFSVDSATATSTISGLTNGTEYYLRMAATNAKGTGTYLQPSSTYTPYGIPTVSVSVSAVGTDTATVTISGNGKGRLVTPTLRIGAYGAFPTPTTFTATTGTFTHTLNLTGLDPGEHYSATARLSFTDSNGNAVRDATPADFTTTPTAVAHLSATSDENSITASWDSFTNPSNAVISYDVTASGATGCSNITASSSGRSACVLSGLTSATTYNVIVSASISGGGVGNGTSALASISVTTKSANTISFSLAAFTKNYGDSAFTIAATASSGLSVLFTSTTLAICSVSGSTLTILASGVCTVVASQAGNSSYAAADSVTQNLAIGLKTQTITFTAPTSATYGDSPIAVNVDVNSPGSVLITTSSTYVCSVNSYIVTFVGAGTCVLKANASAFTSYAAASEVSRSIVVGKASQSITFPAMSGKAYGAAAFALANPASSSSGLNVSYASSTTSICTNAGSVITIKEVGTCTIVATQSGNDNYNAAPSVTKSFTVSKASQTISFPTISDRRRDSGSFSVTVSATSNLTVSIASSTTTVCTVSSLTISMLTNGTCTLVASQGGDSHFEAATDISVSFDVNGKTDAVLGLFPDETKSYADGSFTITAPTASVSGSFSYFSNNTFILPISGSTATIGYIGDVTLTAVFTPSDTATYNGSSVTKTITITAANQDPLVVVASKFGSAYFLSTTGGTGFGFVSFALALDASSDCTLQSWGYLTRTGEGICKVIATKATDGMHLEATSASTSITFSKATQTINFSLSGLGTVNYGSWPQYLTATSSAWLPVTLTSTTSTICSISSGSLTPLKAGTCTIAASQSGNSTYAAAVTVTDSITIHKLPLTVSISDVYLTVGEDFDSSTVSASFSGFLTYPVSESQSDLGGSFSCTTTYTNASNAGTYPITCSGYTSDNYEISYISASLIATASFLNAPSVSTPGWPQNLTFDRIDGTRRVLADATIDLNHYAHVDSGLLIQFTTSPLSVCTVTKFGILNMLEIGSCTVTAAVPAQAGYDAASSLMQSFTIYAANESSGGSPYSPPPSTPASSAPIPAPTPEPAAIKEEVKPVVVTPEIKPTVEPTPPVIDDKPTLPTAAKSEIIAKAQANVVTQKKVLVQIRATYVAAVAKAKLVYNQAIASAHKYIKQPKKYAQLIAAAKSAYTKSCASALKTRNIAKTKALALIQKSNQIIATNA